MSLVLECPPDTNKYILLFVRLRTSKKFGFSGIIAIFAVEINIKTIMNYTYRHTHDFETALDWVLCSLLRDNVFFRFTFESFRCVRTGPWMSPYQCLQYMRCTTSEFEFKTLTMRVCA